MVLIGECCVCGAPNRPGVSKHTVTVHRYTSFTDCGDPSCDAHATSMIEAEEHDKATFMKYYFRGNTEKISIPRSDPTLPNATGFLRSGQTRESQYDFLQFAGKHPKFPVRWGTDGSLMEKIMKYQILARHNLHLPLVVVVSHSDPQSSSYIELNNSLYSYCCMTNKATFLLLLSYALDSGFFSILPIELVRMIVEFYFESWEKSI